MTSFKEALISNLPLALTLIAGVISYFIKRKYDMIDKRNEKKFDLFYTSRMARFNDFFIFMVDDIQFLYYFDGSQSIRHSLTIDLIFAADSPDFSNISLRCNRDLQRITSFANKNFLSLSVKVTRQVTG